MTSGSGLRICYQAQPIGLGQRLRIIACLLKQCCIATGQVFLGGIYLGALVVHSRHRRWSETGVWERVFKALAKDADNEYAMIDSTIVRAHQHSAGAKKSQRRPGNRTFTRRVEH